MKTSVRFLSMLLAILMIAGAALTASAAGTEKKENDKALQLLVDLGILGGYDDGSLKPEKLVERDEMAKIIFVLYTTFTDAGAGAATFKDVPGDNWAAGYISWCSSKGIVGGYGDGNFGPDDNVTYDQALKMVAGALGYTDWDSKFWPVDVRMKTLTDLNLGENITGVAGGDYVTRAQVAQIVYNALFAPMNETKTIEQKLPGTEFLFPVSVPKTLAVDTWNFGEVYTRITAVDGIGMNIEDKDVTLDGLGEFSLEELGLSEYANELTDILFANVKLIYDAKQGFDTESIIASSLVVAAEEEVAIVYNEKEDKVIVGDEEIDDDARVISVDVRGNIVYSPLTSEQVPAEDSLYTSIAYDLDEDGKFDIVYWDYLAAFVVTGKTDKETRIALYGDPNTTFAIKNENIVLSSGVLEEEDVFVGKFIYNDLYVEKVVAPVTAAAAKYSGTKLTLADVGEVQINKEVFVPNSIRMIYEDVMELNDKGETTAYNYYIYDGKVFGSDTIVNDSELQFAVLSYINAPEKNVFNEITKDNETLYTAVVTIDGKEKTVDLNPDDTIDELGIADNEDAILAEYGKVYTNNGVDAVEGIGKYILNRNILVTYTVDEDGFYTFTTAPETEDYIVYPAGTTVEYDKKTGIYKLYNAEGILLTNRAVFADTAVIYYTYQKETTGKYTYLGAYTATTLPENFAKMTTTSPIYAKADEDEIFIEIAFTMVDGKSIEYQKDATADFRTDARQIFYCYQNSNQVMAEDSKNLNYSYFMRPIYNGGNLVESVNTELTAKEGATNAKQGSLYAWDEETKNYVQISKSTLEELGVTSIGMYTFDDLINGCIITEAGSKYADGIKIAPDASIWCLGGTATSFVTLTVEGIQTSLDIAEEGELTTRVIIGTSLDDNGEEIASVVIIEQVVYNSSGDPAYNTRTLFNSFAG
ncbi:MAG: S-layer homology domain-containing protein [Ruminococcaceae bacterium]|nr:S-layer homology domain-containing protein [Oscillospiraceae bacterium]